MREHVPELDGVRALAILLVIPHNADRFIGSVGALWPVAQLAHAGWIGVQLFFVLSGFLITGNLIESQRAPNYYGAFYGRRVLRIFPLYFAVLVVGLLIIPMLIPLSAETLDSHRHQLWLWTFLSNWAEPYGATVTGYSHFWSLAVEEQFYLLWPFIVHRLSVTQILRLSLALVIAALAIRLAMWRIGASAEMLYMFTFCRMDALAAGAAAAALIRMPGCSAWLARNRMRLLGLAAAGALVGAIGTHEYSVFSFTTLTIGQSLLSLVFAMFILYAVTHRTDGRVGRIPALLRSRPLGSIGRYSYAMYVFHLPIAMAIPFALFSPLGALAPLALALTVLVATYLAAALSWHLLEKHFLKLKRYFVPATTPATA